MDDDERFLAIDFSVRPEDMAGFRSLSGDDNPLHHDNSFAEARGFRGPVVYGALIIAQVSRLLGTRLPGHGCVWRSLSLQFRNPLYVGEPARLTAEILHSNEDLGTYQLALVVESGGRCIAKGEAAATLLRERVAIDA